MFKVGDRIKCEAGKTNEECPRWNDTIDNGATGVWLYGTVVDVNKLYNNITTKLDNGIRWAWDMDNVPSPPGWLELAMENVNVEKKKPRLITKYDPKVGTYTCLEY